MSCASLNEPAARRGLQPWGNGVRSVPQRGSRGENRSCRGEPPRNPRGEGRIMVVYCDDWRYVEMDTPPDG